jgi:hypothetical protein
MIIIYVLWCRLSGYLEDLIVPSKDTIGERLLRKMGWRKGQAIGVRRKFKKPVTEKKVPKKLYGVQLPPELLATREDENDEEEEEEEEEENKDYYFSQDTVTVEYNHKEDSFGIGYNPYGEGSSKAKKSSANFQTSNTSTKFGLGAFEDADDIEVYDSENLELYDKVLGEGAQTKSVNKPDSGFNENLSSGKCSDGSLPLRGFRVSSRPMSKPKWFPPPTLPPGYKPLINQQSATSTAMHTGMAISPAERGKILGETPLPSTPTPQKDVFSYIAPQDRDKLFALTNRFTSSSTETFEFKTSETIEWESREKNKIFTETAAKFKPMSVAMSQRFVGGTIIDSTGRELDKEAKTETYQETAAAMNMFGKLTRAYEEWYPTPLLCKRFNLKNPHQGKEIPQKKEQPSTLGLDILPTGIDAPTSMEYQGPSHNTSQEDYSSQQPIEGPQTQQEEEEIEEELPNEEKPSIDLFKAIFEDNETEESIPQIINSKSEETLPDKVPIVTPFETFISSTASTVYQTEKTLDIDRSSVKSAVIENMPIIEPLKEANPYLSYPQKQDTRGGFATEPKETPKPIPVPIEKRSRYDSDSSDSSPHRSKSEHKEKKEKKRKHEKKEKKYKKDKKDKKRRH